MKNLVFFSLYILCLQANAQTALIAHKSHSGKKITFSSGINSNFGKIYIPPVNSKPIVEEAEQFEYFEVLNDSIVIKMTTDAYQDLKSIDTLSNSARLPLEKFKYEYKRKIENEKQPVTVPKKSEITPNNRSMENGNPENKKQNQPSFLLIFFAVSAVGMIVMRLFRSTQEVSTPVQ